MAVKLSLPVAHRARDGYEVFADRIARGRPFRQPLESRPDPTSTPGLELYLMPVEDVPALYAFVAGELRFEPGPSSGGPHKLVLVPAAGTLRAGTVPRLKLVEAPPARVEYENVDQDGTRDALATLILDAHLAASAIPRRPARWHPAMRVGVEAADRSIFLKHHLDAIPQDQRELEVERIAGELMTSSGATLLADGLPVLAGDAIGVAAPYRAGETPPPAAGTWDPKQPGDPNRARRVTISMIDASGQSADPVFHLNRLVRLHWAGRTLASAARVVESVTALGVGQQPAHPLINAVPALAQEAAPPGRAAVDGVSALTLADLRDFHGYPRNAPVGRNEWRYEDSGSVVARVRTPPQPAVPLAPTAAQSQRVAALWASHGQAIADIGELLQVPTDLIVALACTEALPSLSERSIRLEPLQPAHRLLLQGSAPLEMAYDKAVGVRGDVSGLADLANGHSTVDIDLDGARRWDDAGLLRSRLTWVLWGSQRLRVHSNTTSAQPRTTYTLEIDRPADPPEGEDDPTEAWVLEGYSPPDPGVPNPWPGNAVVRAGSTLTWNQLVTVVTATRGLRVSPGLIQTLVSTARGIVLPWLRAAVPDAWGELGIPAPPAAAGGYLNDWLLHAQHSLLVGAAYMRMEYNQFDTRFDLPLVAGAYNAGSPIRDPGSAWGLEYHGDYVGRAGPHLNAAVAHFDSVPAPAPGPTVAFMR